MHGGLVAVLGLVLAPRPMVGQAPAAPYRVTWGDAASVATAGVLYVLPGALGLPHGAPSCAPCDPATLPGVDRWALRPVSATGDVASDVFLAGVAGFTAFASLQDLPAQQWHGNFAVLASAASWTAASTEWLKVLVRRKRPVLYTSDDNGGDRSGESTVTAFPSRVPRVCGGDVLPGDRAPATPAAPEAEHHPPLCGRGRGGGTPCRGRQTFSNGRASWRFARQRDRLARPNHSSDPAQIPRASPGGGQSPGAPSGRDRWHTALRAVP